MDVDQTIRSRCMIEAGDYDDEVILDIAIDRLWLVLLSEESEDDDG